MTGRSAASPAIRIAAIVALIGIGLAIALMAWHERMTDARADMAHAAAGYLRIAIVLLLVSAAAIILVAVLVARALPPAGERPAAIEQPAADRARERADGELTPRRGLSGAAGAHRAPDVDRRTDPRLLP